MPAFKTVLHTLQYSPPKLSGLRSMCTSWPILAHTFGWNRIRAAINAAAAIRNGDATAPTKTYHHIKPPDSICQIRCYHNNRLTNSKYYAVISKTHRNGKHCK